MEATRPKPFVFVLMPFDHSFADVYSIGIKEACSAAGAYCERLDEQYFTEDMLERIFNQIAKADLIIADMTGKNPNVFYEVGYAHALGKPVILITKNADDIPFDLKHRYHVDYSSGIVSLREQLQPYVRWHLEHPVEAKAYEEEDLEIRINEAPLKGGDRLIVHWKTGFKKVGEQKYFTESWHYMLLRVALHNSAKHAIELMSIKVLLMTPSSFWRSFGCYDRTEMHQAIGLGHGFLIHKPQAACLLAPGEWAQMDFFLTGDRMRESSEPVNFCLKLVSQGPVRDIPFQVHIDKK